MTWYHYINYLVLSAHNTQPCKLSYVYIMSYAILVLYEGQVIVYNY